MQQTADEAKITHLKCLLRDARDNMKALLNEAPFKNANKESAEEGAHKLMLKISAELGEDKIKYIGGSSYFGSGVFCGILIAAAAIFVYFQYLK